MSPYFFFRDFMSPDGMFSFRSKTAVYEYIKLLDNLGFSSPPKNLPKSSRVRPFVKSGKKSKVSSPQTAVQSKVSAPGNSSKFPLQPKQFEVSAVKQELLRIRLTAAPQENIY